jgi:TerC family integral membrane protein
VVFGLLAGWDFAAQYFAGYVVEKSLSVDNLFVFALIFGYFAVPKQYQHRALFYGVIGALVFRAIFIAAGVAIVSKFTAVLFVFAAILLWSAYKLLKGDDTEYDPSTNVAVRLVRKLVPVQDEYVGAKFLVKQAGKWIATPLFVVVVAIEAADLVFAVDSVPAVLAVSDDPFIVYSSNAFAILGLRALYFLLADMHARFTYLQQGLAVILAFVGVKMIIADWYHIPTWLSLVVIALVLTAAIAFSIKSQRGLDEPRPDWDVVHDEPQRVEVPPSHEPSRRDRGGNSG